MVTRFNAPLTKKWRYGKVIRGKPERHAEKHCVVINTMLRSSTYCLVKLTEGLFGHDIEVIMHPIKGQNCS
jgi:hypothetical protein